jgi:multiple sugar transport system permease protein
MRATRLAGWLFAGPALLILFLFFVLPVLGALILSLTDFDIYALASLKNLRFVGLRNYAELLSSPPFWQALGVTAEFVILGAPLSIAASLGTALLINAKSAWLKPVFRTALFAPVVSTIVAVAVIWRYLLHQQYGALNAALGLLGVKPIDWLGDPRWALPAIIFFAVWKTYGYNMIIFAAGLQAVPEDLYDAARLDGANAWGRFFNVTLPSLAPLVALVSILTVAGYLQLFAEPYVMTQGGPLQATTSVLYFMYEQGFKWWSLGSASAVAFLLFLITLLITAAQLGVARRRGAL